MILYEAPHKLMTTLRDLKETLGGERPLSICRELTKLHEEVFRTTIDGAIARYGETTPKGEFVLVLAGASEEKTEYTLEEAVEMARQRINGGLKATDAAKEAARMTGYSKPEIYQRLIQPLRRPE